MNVFRSETFILVLILSKLAFRIKKEYRGLGLGRQIMEIFEDHVDKSFPKNVVTLSCVPDWDLSDEQLRSPKFGNLLLIRPYLVYCFRPSQTVISEGREEDCPAHGSLQYVFVRYSIFGDIFS